MDYKPDMYNKYNENIIISVLKQYQNKICVVNCQWN